MIFLPALSITDVGCLSFWRYLTSSNLMLGGAMNLFLSLCLFDSCDGINLSSLRIAQAFSLYKTNSSLSPIFLYCGLSGQCLDLIASHEKSMPT